MMSDGQPLELRYEELDSIAVHHLFRIKPAASEGRPLKIELEKRYEGVASMTWKTGHNTQCILDRDHNGEVGVVTIALESFWKTDEILSRYL